MFGPTFMQNAFLAGSFIALAGGLTGYFLVLRAQVFAGDALSHMAFTGALAAAAFTIDIRIGLFAATILAGIAMGGLGERARADDVVIGSSFAWILGLGVLFLSIFTTNASATNGTAGVRVLFGSIFGLSTSEAQLAAVIAGAICLITLLIARPLLFASLDSDVAQAKGLPIRLLGLGFLGLFGAEAAEATQAIGALLLLALVAAPAGAAQLLTTRPFRGLALSAGIALGSLWAGLALAYEIPSMPPSFSITAVATTAFAVALLIRYRDHVPTGETTARSGIPREQPSRGRTAS
jgi:zinc/manganese transport system permease protein